MAEKQCKKCMSMIDEGASICPQCQSKQPSRSKNIVVLLLVFVIIVTFSKSCSQPVTNQASTQPTITEEPLTTKGKAVKAKHPGWSNNVCNTIANKKIHIGMTTEQVRAAWGKPYQINTTTGTYGTHEQWVMHEYGNEYVYFENGIMTTLQQSK